MSLTSEDRQIYKLLNNKAFIVPANQRKYVWTFDNWMELFEDISLIYDGINNEHFIGSIVLKTEDIDDGIREHFSIIDGQQRVLTISMLISVIGYMYAAAGAFERLDGIKQYLMAQDRQGGWHPIVSRAANIELSDYISTLFDAAEKARTGGQTIISLESMLKKSMIKEGVVYFYNALYTKTHNDIDCLDRFEKIIEEIRYIDVTATTDEDAYAIFEVLNARGQELSNFDLLRNYLLKNIPDENKTESSQKIANIEQLLGDKAEIFLKHYVKHKYGEKTDNKNKSSYKIIVKKEKSSDKVRFLQDLQLKAEFYDKILNQTDCTVLETKVFKFFRSHNQQQFRPLLLGLMHQKSLGKLNCETYEEMVSYLYKFFVCYKLIGQQTSNKIDDIVDGYAGKLESKFTLELLSELKGSMVKRLPSEDAFVSSLIRIRYSSKWKAYSGKQNAETVRAVFEYYEHELGYQGAIDTNYNIEHCNPDSLSEENSLIGNLMLLESDLNDEAGNKKPSEKILIYKRSRLTCPQIVSAELENNAFDPNNRAKKIAKTIYDSINELSK